MFMSTLDFSSQLQSHISNCPLNTFPWVSHSQLQLNSRACFAFSFLHLGKWQVHPLSCSNTKHGSWFPFLLLTHPQGIHQKILLAVFSKYIQNLTISYYVYQYYRSRPPWLLASHQCNCLLIFFFALTKQAEYFFPIMSYIMTDKTYSVPGTIHRDLYPSLILKVYSPKVFSVHFPG